MIGSVQAWPQWLPAKVARMTLLGLFSRASGAASAQQLPIPQVHKGGVAEISSTGPQTRSGEMTTADGDVDIHYQDRRLRADHVEYNEDTDEAIARGHVQFDYNNQHLEGDEAHYNLATGKGTFLNVRGNIRIVRQPNPTLLITDNPLSFEAREVDRIAQDDYIIKDGKFTVCDPEHPTWQFFAPKAHVLVDKKAILFNSDFRIFQIPLVWLPYATTPASENVRQSGLLVPAIGSSTVKGFILGDAYYWAPQPWLDTTLGAELLSKRGSSQRGQFRAKPWENTSIDYSYAGVVDRLGQGGHEQHLEIRSQLPENTRFVVDYNELSSLTYRLAFSDTFGDAINSEVRSAIFASHNFNGFSLNFGALNDESFVSTNPQTSVTVRNAPQARFSSVEQAPWRKYRTNLFLVRYICRNGAPGRYGDRYGRCCGAAGIRAQRDDSRFTLGRGSISPQMPSSGLLILAIRSIRWATSLGAA